MNKQTKERKRLKKQRIKSEWKKEQKSHHTQNVDDRLKNIGGGSYDSQLIKQNEKTIQSFQRVQRLRNEKQRRKKNDGV